MKDRTRVEVNIKTNELVEKILKEKDLFED